MFSIEDLWEKMGFIPNREQHDAILHTDGPLYLTAGPGSGKTRVLLWRTLNLIVFHDVRPEEIFLSTFTEKAALQLKEGLRSLLGAVTNFNDKHYDIAQMYVGTVHSLCQRLLSDRRFSKDRGRAKLPVLLDDLSQYFHVSKSYNWSEFTASMENPAEANRILNGYFGKQGASKHDAVTNCITFLNRISEECIDYEQALATTSDVELQNLLQIYCIYRSKLQLSNGIKLTDFALLQQFAYDGLENHALSNQVFKHIIIDEYQDTNTIQERIFFRLASGYRNICVVGDDDQALYRFRGATVENFVQFPERCQQYLNVSPSRIKLNTNYRSRNSIVEFYTQFMRNCDWAGSNGKHYRVIDKNIVAHSEDKQVAVIASNPDNKDNVSREIAEFVRQLLDEGKVENANQIAFLFPSLKSVMVETMQDALEQVGLRVYAPRAKTFLEVDESIDVFGIYLKVFGKPGRGNFTSSDYTKFHDWLDRAEARGTELMQADRQLAQFIIDRRNQLTTSASDYKALMKVIAQNQWSMQMPYSIDVMKRPLHSAAGLSETAKKTLISSYFERFVRSCEDKGKPLNLEYVVARVTSIQWSVLDLFYRICGFEHFKKMFDLAEGGVDEGPICNLGLITQYLARYMDEYVPIIMAKHLADDKFQRMFFILYLYALYRRGESEYEDANDPFPKGRIPFLTIHQSKGLEFPVVVLGNPRKDNHGAQPVEKLVRPLINRQGEPLDRVAEFDTMRMFYVALSRAQNLLVIAHPKGQGIRINEPFKTMLDNRFPRIQAFNMSTLPESKLAEDTLPRSYSFTSDYLLYDKCPRQYMIFKKYGFIPSRSQTMFFGNLVHHTLEDLHQHLIALKEHNNG